MGYEERRGEGLKDAYREGFVERSGREVVDRVMGTKADTRRRPLPLLPRAIAKTPEAEIPRAYRGDRRAWIMDRRSFFHPDGREPGTLKRAWDRGPVEPTEEGYAADATNEDPIFDYVERDTVDHAIVGRRSPHRMLKFPSGARFIFRRRVWHPGTEGQHMARDAAAEIEVEDAVIAERVIAEAAREENRRP